MTHFLFKKKKCRPLCSWPHNPAVCVYKNSIISINNAGELRRSWETDMTEMVMDVLTRFYYCKSHQEKSLNPRTKCE